MASANPGPTGTSGSSGKPTPQPQQPVIMWWIPLVILLIWNVIGYFYQPSQTESTTIPYTTFLEQVKADNVVKVDIRGAKIVGAFRKPTSLPAAVSSDAGQLETAPATVPASTTKPSEQTAAKPAAKTEKPPAYEMFYTVFPESLGDPQLLPLLENHHVDIMAFPDTSPWFVKLFWNVLPFALLMLFISWMGKRAARQQGSIFGMGKSTGKLFDPERSTGVTFEDVAGCESAKQQLLETVAFLKEPGKYQSIGAKIPRGMLLSGPPGTGKTLLAKAVAGEAGVPFFSVSGSEFMQMFVGVGASRVRDLFDKAGEAAPAIVFIDELDAIGRNRGASFGMTNDEREQTLNQLLVAMDGFDERQNVIVLAATNRPDVLDPALLRPGRFDRQIVVGLPDAREREQILKVHTRVFKLEADVDLAVLAGMTIGMNGAQLANLCNEAALYAAREGKQSVRQADFEAALDKVILGDVRPLALDTATRRVIAYHEGGHALVAWLLAKADPVHKVTIIPHGQALGVTEQRPGAEQYNYPKSYLLARLAVMLGGRTAEEIVMGDITTGAENDLQQATRLARHMVTAWGMSELGLAAYEGNGQEQFLGYNPYQQRQYSEQTAARIDAAVTELLEERHQTVQQLLTNARSKLDQLAEALLSHESVNYDALVSLLGPPAHLEPGDKHA